MIVIVAVRGIPGTLRRRLTASPRPRVLRLLRETSPGLLVMLGLFIAADGFLPILALVALGRAVGDAPSEAALFASYREAAHGTQAADGTGVGTITVLVSHRFGTVHMADQIIVLDGGRVAESGDHQQLIDRGGIYAELFALQAAGYRP